MATEQGMLEFEHQPSSTSGSYDDPITMVKKAWTAFRLLTRSSLSPAHDSIAEQIREYDEPTFRLLLNLEEIRCKRSGRGFHLLLCTVSAQDGTPVTMNDTVATLVFTQTRKSLRNTDYTGWFLQNRTVGIVLTCLEPGTGVASSRRVIDHLRRILTNTLSLHDPSLVLQLYDDLQLPLFDQHQATEALTQTHARQD